jgi:hypothetical protein
MIRAYFRMLLEEAEASQALPRDGRMGETAGKMKQFASWFTHGVPGGAKLRGAIYQAKTGEAVLAEVDAFFTAQPVNESDAGEQFDTDNDSPDFSDAAMVCD